jgi:hypothetical protein
MEKDLEIVFILLLQTVLLIFMKQMIIYSFVVYQIF